MRKYVKKLLFYKKQITCHDVVNTYCQHIKKVNPILNAVIENRFGEAIFEAKICDEQLADGKFDIETLEKDKPLYGIPVTVKECCAAKGIINFLLYRNNLYLFVFLKYHLIIS